MQGLILFVLLGATYLMVIAKRTPALIRSFRYQSFCLFAMTLLLAIAHSHGELYVVAGLLFVLKVSLIPALLFRIIRQIKVGEDIGLIINPQLSLFWGLIFTYLSWIFASYLIGASNAILTGTLAISFFVVLAGLFLMVFRMTALAQIIGLLVMENGLFLLASTVSGGMPFLVEIAIFFDVFVSVVIMGFFVYRINKLFTHIDVNKLKRLKG
jgi:hydrogenase-4 component E